MACAGSAATSNLPHAQVRCASGGHDSLRSQWSHEEFDGGELTASDIAFKGQSRRPTCFYKLISATCLCGLPVRPVGRCVMFRQQRAFSSPRSSSRSRRQPRTAARTRRGRSSPLASWEGRSGQLRHLAAGDDWSAGAVQQGRPVRAAEQRYQVR